MRSSLLRLIDLVVRRDERYPGIPEAALTREERELLAIGAEWERLRGSSDPRRAARAGELAARARRMWSAWQDAVERGAILTMAGLHDLHAARPGILLALLQQQDPMIRRPVWRAPSTDPAALAPGSSVAAFIIGTCGAAAAEVVFGDLGLADSPSDWTGNGPPLGALALDAGSAENARAAAMRVLADPALAAIRCGTYYTFEPATLAHRAAVLLVRSSSGDTSTHARAGTWMPHLVDASGRTPLGAAVDPLRYGARYVALLRRHPELLDERADRDGRTVRDVFKTALAESRLGTRTTFDPGEIVAVAALLATHTPSERGSDAANDPLLRAKIRATNPALAALLDATDHAAVDLSPAPVPPKSVVGLGS